MALHLHRAPRTDLLADALGDLLSTPLADPFATELVLVPARGVERWLSQRLSHRLGTSAGGSDGVCAGVEFRFPRSLVAELSGTRDDDPWAPDALAWPLLSVLDASMDEPWAATLAAHEDTINAELLSVQGHPADIGGYYLPDPVKTAAVMRPSATLNAAIDDF